MPTCCLRLKKVAIRYVSTGNCTQDLELACVSSCSSAELSKTMPQRLGIEPRSWAQWLIFFLLNYGGLMCFSFSVTRKNCVSRDKYSQCVNINWCTSGSLIGSKAYHAMHKHRHLWSSVINPVRNFFVLKCNSNTVYTHYVPLSFLNTRNTRISAFKSSLLSASKCTC